MKADSRMILRGLISVLLSAVTALAADRLYLKDGDFQLVREFQIAQDRVRYYSIERSDWEEIPLELIDLDRTRKEAASIKAEADREDKERAEEDAALRAARQQVASVPKAPGVYYIQGDKLDAWKGTESKIVTDKKRTILKLLSPVPMLTGKSTVELDGETAPRKVEGARPEFYFRLSDFESFAIVRLTPKKGGTRIVENVSTLSLKGERWIDETRQIVPTFKKQEDDNLYKIWPEKPLETGEYALMQFTDGKLNPQIWDFSVAAK